MHLINLHKKRGKEERERRSIWKHRKELQRRIRRTMWNKDGTGILKQKSRRKRIREEEKRSKMKRVGERGKGEEKNRKRGIENSFHPMCSKRGKNMLKKRTE